MKQIFVLFNKVIKVLFFKDPNEGKANHSKIFHNLFIVTEIMSEVFSEKWVGEGTNPYISINKNLFNFLISFFD